MPLDALIVDDEPMARRRIRDLLDSRPEIRVCGQCGDGREAVAAIRAFRPDLVFLDIQMPGMSGFDVLTELRDEELPEIIFTTAHDRFALRAFEVHAIDYLLKPYDRERFNKAVDAACARARGGRKAVREVATLLAQLRDRSAGIDRFPIKTDGRIMFVETERIRWIEAANNYAVLHVDGATHIVRETMTKLESRLPADRFARLNRSTIVNVTCIRELRPKFHGDYTVVLKDGTRLNLSRNRRDHLEQLTRHLIG